MKLRLTHAEKLCSIDTARAVELLVLHRKEAFTTDCLVGALDRINLLTKDRKTNLLADQVGVRAKLNQVSMNVAISKLSHQAFLDHLLVGSLVIRDIQCGFLW